jgi:hypothetical protein
MNALLTAMIIIPLSATALIGLALLAEAFLEDDNL